MKWQHYNEIKSSMRYIESLLRDIEKSLNSDEKSIYEPVRVDLTKKEIAQVKKELKKLFADLEEAKKSFGLEVEPINASKIIEVNTGFVWKTIEDTWSHKIEKTSGKISSDEKKKQIDALLDKILKSSNRIREAVKLGKF
jgi:phage-related protein